MAPTTPASRKILRERLRTARSAFQQKARNKALKQKFGQRLKAR